jgi:hypothetical protein
MLDDIKRVLKPGGWLFITTPNLGSWFNRFSLLFGFQPVYTEVSTRANAGHMINLPGQPAGHIRMFTLRALKELVKREGFMIEESFGIGLNPGMHSGHKWIYLVLNFIFSHPDLSSGLAILAKTPGK